MGRIIVFDTETNGFMPEHRIIELTAMAIVGDMPVDNISTLVDSVTHIPLSAHKVHGIKLSDLKGQPKPDVVYPCLSGYIGNSPIVGHSVGFDKRFLEKEFTLMGLPLPTTYIDTLAIARKLYPSLPNHKLQTVHNYLCGSVTKQTHRSLGDVMMTAEIWLIMRESYQSKFGQVLHR